MRKKRSLLIAGLLAVSMMASGVVCAYADTAGAEGAADAASVEEVPAEEAGDISEADLEAELKSALDALITELSGEAAPAEEAAAEEEAAPEEAEEAATAEEAEPAESEEAAPEEAEEAAPAEEAAAEAEEAEAVEEAPAEAEEASDAAAPAVGLTGLSVRDGSLKKIFEGFDADKTEYEVNVQSDIYGVLIDTEAPLGTKITVTADTDAYAYDGTLNYEAGSKIPYDFDLDGYVVQLSQAYEDYDKEFVQTVTITASSAGESKDYKVVITRADDSKVYALFEEKEFTDSNGTVIPYELYVPSNYDESKKYPVVFALHGSGQRTQPLDMLLKRYQMATIWAKDSEAGHNECIVLAPQCTVEDANLENWTTLMANRAGEAEDAFAPMPQLDAAYELLQEVLGEYSCDPDRVYMTGLSAGGYATFTLAQMYPETFAAIAPDASAADPEAVEALKDIPMWIFQAADDPTVPVDTNYYPTIQALDAAGISYKKTVYKKGAVFFPSAHFSWVPMYANEEFRDWMFAQSK
jgi:predicted peptidase